MKRDVTDSDEWEYDRDPEGFKVETRKHPLTGQRHAVILPARARKLDGETFALFSRAQHAGIAIGEQMELLGELVPELRKRNVSWSLIGWAVGLTGEAVRQKWGDTP